MRVYSRSKAGIRYISTIGAAPAALLTAAFIIITVLAVSAWALLAPAPNGIPPREHTDKNALPTTAAHQGNAAQRRFGVEMIRILPTGFDPQQITRPAGPIFFAVNNRSGLREVVLRLSDEAGHRLYEVHANQGSRAWRQLNRST